MDGVTAFNSFPGGTRERIKSLAGGAVLGRTGKRDRGRETEASWVGRSEAEPGNEMKETKCL